MYPLVSGAFGLGALGCLGFRTLGISSSYAPTGAAQMFCSGGRPTKETVQKELTTIRCQQQ